MAPFTVTEGGGHESSSALAAAVRSMAANWPDPDDTIEAISAVMALRPSAERVAEQLAEPGVVLDDESAAAAVQLLHRLARLQLATGYHAASARHLETATRLARWRGDVEMEVALEVDLAQAEARGANPEDRTLADRRARGAVRLERLLTAMGTDDRSWPLAFVRHQRLTESRGDRGILETVQRLTAAHELASSAVVPADDRVEICVRLAVMMRDELGMVDEALGMQLALLHELSQASATARAEVELRNSIAIAARRIAPQRGPAGWTEAIAQRQASVDLAARWLDEAIRADPNGADGYQREVARCLDNKGVLLVSAGRPEAARVAVERSIALTREGWFVPVGNLATRLANLADADFALGRFDLAAEELAEAVALGDRIGSRRGAARLSALIQCRLLGGGSPVDLQPIMADVDRRIAHGETEMPHRPLAARGLLLSASGDEHGLDHLHQAVASRSEQRTSRHPDVLRLKALLALGLAKLGRADEVAVVRSEIRSGIRQSFGHEDHWIVSLSERSW